MRLSIFLVGLGALFVRGVHGTELELLTDISKISRHWGQMSTYADNADNIFGVDHVGLPDGCQVEAVQTLQRHAERFPITYIEDGLNNQRFADKVTNFSSNSTALFEGPLSFLNGYRYPVTADGLLTGKGATTEFASGVSFWNKYGRTLYNASVGQLAYNASFPNGTARPPVVLRTTSQARIENSMINWALGFFGSSNELSPNPTFENATSPFEVVVIPEGGTENNTLASYDSCFNDFDPVIGILGDLDVFEYIPRYLGAATKRLQKYAPEGFIFSNNDTYAMQTICAYEHAFIGMSEFCELFTADEWNGYENTLDISYYYDYGYGNPTGRAQGIGYVTEMLARLNHTLLYESNTSVNYTITNNSAQFPLNQPFYADFSHDDIIISTLAAMSIDYFRDPPSLTEYPPDTHRKFILSELTPFGAKLITETIGCAISDPQEVRNSRVYYTPGQYGYDPANSTYKFVRMRVNNGIVPLASIRGGACEERRDGLCALEDFMRSQEASEGLANYQYACFGNWTDSVSSQVATSGKDWDGTIFE